MDRLGFCWLWVKQEVEMFIFNRFFSCYVENRLWERKMGVRSLVRDCSNDVELLYFGF